MQQVDYDIIVIGAGNVGLAFAAAAANSGLQVVVIDNQVIQRKISGDNQIRVSAINRAAQNFLTHLDAWQLIEKNSINSFQAMQVWDASGTGEINFNAVEIAQPDLGHIVFNHALQQALLQVSNNKNITLLEAAAVQTLKVEAKFATIELGDGRKLQAKLIVGADGANSWVREQADIATKVASYQQQALIATVHTQLKHEATARQRFLTNGVLAFLPLREQNHCSIVWSVETQKAKRLKNLAPAEFNAELNAAFDSRLGEVELTSELQCYPLFMRHAQHYVKSRIALIGDAVATIHPLAGQGINLGLMDAAWLAQIIAETNAQKRDIGYLNNLRKYERARKADHQIMLAAMSSFKHLFSLQQKTLIKTRNIGLSFADKNHWLKNFFSEYALGLRGDLPKDGWT